jgi:PilZ domain
VPVSRHPSESPEPVLLLGPDSSVRRIAGPLLLLGYRGVPANDAGSVRRAQERGGPMACAGLIASDHGLPDAAASIREIHELLAGSLVWTVWGTRVEGDAAHALRAAGVRFALADPFSEEELRFVLNEASQLHNTDAPRMDARVPTTLRARVVTKTGERLALVCNLSLSGAYLATPRPALRGGRVELELPLPESDVRVIADVLWNNVPGNLQRAHAPVGMGVRFVEVPAEAEPALRAFLAERAAAYRL